MNIAIESTNAIGRDDRKFMQSCIINTKNDYNTRNIVLVALSRLILLDSRSKKGRRFLSWRRRMAGYISNRRWHLLEMNDNTNMVNHMLHYKTLR
jgi:hypothetical protein